VVFCSKHFKNYFFVLVLIAMSPMSGVCETPSSQNLVIEHMKLPAQFKNADGSSYSAKLDAMVIRPDDNQKHPLMTMTHAYDLVDPRGIFADEFQDRAVEFARRGWVVVAFTRRGYGLSDGPFVERLYDCSESSIVLVGKVSAADIREVIRLMVQRPYVDASRLVSVGFARSGYATLALAAEPPPGLVAAINFSGELNLHEDCSHQYLNDAVASLGKSSRIPTLWIYSSNDNIISLPQAKQLHAAYVGAGGNAEFIVAPSFQNDGHGIFRYGIPIWTPYVDSFLQKQGLAPMHGLLPVSGMREINDDD